MSTQYDRAVESLVGRDVWKIIPVNSRESILIASSLEKVAVAIKRILRCPMENVFVTSKEAVAIHIGAKGTISTHKFFIEKVKLVETTNLKGEKEDRKPKIVRAILSAGKIVDIEVDGKSPHHRGESATIWTFESGGKLFEYDGWWEFEHPIEGIIPYPDEEEDDA